ncbi:MAG: alpha/beta fold hydrolase [Victivallales bacterium]|nr:alpha/beta fold hydrolase [Victivallales bacterium]
MTTSAGHRLHYVDFGRGLPVVLLHGHPTWGFYYRDLVPLLATTVHRTITVDQIGYGLSDHPKDWDYHLAGHIQNFTALVDDHLKLPRFDLVMQGWGNIIGLNYAIAHPDRIRRIVLLNSTTFPKFLPKGYSLLRLPVIGKMLAQSHRYLMQNLAGNHVRHLPKIVARAYLAPYDNPEERTVMSRFIEDLPFSKKHPSWELYHNIEAGIERIAKKPFLILWGERDSIVPMEVFYHWKDLVPNALALSFPNAGHLLLEDESTEANALIARFLVPRRC